MASNFSQLEESLKYYYMNGYVQDQFLRELPFLNRLKKTKMVFGRGYVHAIRDRRGGVISHVASLAIANAGKNAAVKNLTVRTNRWHAAVDLDAKDIARAKSPDAAFIKQVTDNLDDQINGVTERIAYGVVGDGTLSIATMLAAGVAIPGGGTTVAPTTTAFYVSPFHATQLTPQMQISFLNLVGTGDISGTPSPDASTGATAYSDATIQTVDYQSGLVTLDSFSNLKVSTATPTALPNTSNIRIGTKGAWIIKQTYTAVSGTTQPFVPVAMASALLADYTLLGVGAWIPDVVTSVPFCGLDRTSAGSPQLFAGWRQSSVLAGNDDLTKAIFDMCATIRIRAKARPDTLLMSLGRYTELLKGRINGQHIITESREENAKLGIGAIASMMTPSGSLEIVVDTNMPDNKVYVLTSSGWELGYESDGLVELVNDDGYYLSRMTSDDGLQARYRSFSQLLCHFPIENGVILLSGTFTP